MRILHQQIRKLVHPSYYKIRILTEILHCACFRSQWSTWSQWPQWWGHTKPIFGEKCLENNNKVYLSCIGSLFFKECIEIGVLLCLHWDMVLLCYSMVPQWHPRRSHNTHYFVRTAMNMLGQLPTSWVSYKHVWTATNIFGHLPTCWDSNQHFKNYQHFSQDL